MQTLNAIWPLAISVGVILRDVRRLFQARISDPTQGDADAPSDPSPRPVLWMLVHLQNRLHTVLWMLVHLSELPGPGHRES